MDIASLITILIEYTIYCISISLHYIILYVLGVFIVFYSTKNKRDKTTFTSPTFVKSDNKKILFKTIEKFIKSIQK